MTNEQPAYQKTWFVFAKFLVSSLSAVAVDLVVFQLVVFLLADWELAIQIWTATIIARVVSASYHYLVNRNIVFHDDQKVLGTLVAFFALQICIMLASAFLVALLADYLLLPSIVIKIGVDACLFFVNYAVQKFVIFNR